MNAAHPAGAGAPADSTPSTSLAVATTAATNLATPLTGYDVVQSDLALVEAVRRAASNPEEVLGSLKDLGELGGTAEAREHGMLANHNEPVLETFDRFGHRIDEVAFHPSWHWLMERAVGFGLAATPWTSDDPDAHLRGPPASSPGHRSKVVTAAPSR